MLNWVAVAATAGPLAAWLVYTTRKSNQGLVGAAAAAKNGFGFNSGDPFQLSALPFDLFEQTDGQITNTTWTTHENIHMAAAEYARGDTTGSVALADFSYNIPPLRVYARGIQSPFQHERAGVELKNPEFNNRFVVECDYPQLVDELIGHRMIESLLDAKFEFGFEFNAGRFVLFTADVEDAKTLFQTVKRTLDAVALPWWAQREYYSLSGKPAPLGLPVAAPA